MFVFLSGGVNYDNLANALCMAGLFFEVRVFNGKNFLQNSLLWMIVISLGTLVKYTILPLALFMAIAWILFIFIKKKNINLEKSKKSSIILMGLFLLIIVAANVSIYGVNLLKFHSILPDCRDLYTNEQCQTSRFEERYQELVLDHKLSIIESIELGYPNPIEYVIDSWVPNMLYRIFGILGHVSYFPSHIIVLYRLLLFWLIILAARYMKRPSFTTISLLCMALLYAMILLIMNYNSELTYGFKQIAMQGRYIFPVIGIIYVFTSLVLNNVKNRFIRRATTFLTIGLFFIGGPIKFILDYNSTFLGWFVGN